MLKLSIPISTVKPVNDNAAIETKPEQQKQQPVFNPLNITKQTKAGNNATNEQVKKESAAVSIPTAAISSQAAQVKFSVSGIDTNNGVSVNTPVLEATPDQQLANAVITERLATLKADLELANPNIGENLRFIHRALLDDPAQVTILTDADRAVFFQGLMKQTLTVITATASKTRQTSKKDYANTTVDDLM